MSSILQNVPDVTTFAANVVVFLAAISAAVVGSMTAVKAIKKSLIETFKDDNTPAATVTRTEVLGGIFQDVFDAKAIASGTEVNTVATNENTEEVRDLRLAICAMRDDLRENRHTMERLIDAIRSAANVR